MNGKPAPLDRSWFKDLEYDLRCATTAALVISILLLLLPLLSSSSPSSLKGSALFPLLAVGNHLHPRMENFLWLGRVVGQISADTAPPVIAHGTTGALEWSSPQHDLSCETDPRVDVCSLCILKIIKAISSYLSSLFRKCFNTMFTLHFILYT